MSAWILAGSLLTVAAVLVFGLYVWARVVRRASRVMEELDR